MERPFLVRASIRQPFSEGSRRLFALDLQRNETPRRAGEATTGVTMAIVMLVGAPSLTSDAFAAVELLYELRQTGKTLVFM